MLEYNQNIELSDEMKAILDERLEEDEKTYLSSEESLNHLRENIVFNQIIALLFNFF